MGRINSISIFLILGFFIHCSSIPMGKEKIDKPILFNSIRVQKSISFKIEVEYIYWIGVNMKDSPSISQLLNTELLKYPKAKGIMNLNIQYFDAYHDSPQSFYINPINFFTSTGFQFASTVILFSKKSVKISGDVFF